MQTKLVIGFSVLMVVVLSSVVAGTIAYNVTRKTTARLMQPKALSLQKLSIVDASGRTYITFSEANGVPAVDLIDARGEKRITMTVDADGYGAIHLTNPKSSGPMASLEIDDKGAHVKFDRPGGASSYLFLNNSGGSGAVFLDTRGIRKLDLLVSPSGQTEIRRHDRPSFQAQ